MRKASLLGLMLALTWFIALPQISQTQERSTERPPVPERERPPAQAEKARPAGLQAGTKITAELESTVDTRTAKPGDEVAARVTKDVKHKGQTLVRKGDRILGRITAVEAAANADAGSRLAVTFDRLVRGERVSELNAVISAVVSTPSEERARRKRAMASEPPAPMPASGSASGSGSLLGGAASSMDSAAGSAASSAGAASSAAGSTVGNVGSAVEATTHTSVTSSTGVAAATPLRAIRLDSQTQAEHQTSASSVLSTRQGHLRLESGTRLRFRVAAESQAQDSPN